MSENVPVFDRVPRTTEEEALLLASKPDAWEYLLFGAVLLRKSNELDAKWREHQQRYRPPSEPLSDSEAAEQLAGLTEELTAIFEDVGRQTNLELQEQAFGKPGEAGNATRITELAEGLIADYRKLLDHSALLRGTGIPDRWSPAYDLVSEAPSRLLGQLHDFVNDIVHDLDDLAVALRDDLPLKPIDLVIDVGLEEGWAERCNREINRVTAEVVAETEAETRRLDQETERLEQEADRVEQEAARRGNPVVATAGRPSERRSGLLGIIGAHKAKAAAREHETALAGWQIERDGAAERLTLAKTYTGEQSSTGLLLKPGEAVFATITGAALVEDRAGAGQWQGRSSGVSIPIGSLGGRSVRYRVGSSRGHFVQG